MKHALPNCPFLFFSFQKYNFRAEKARYLLDRLRGPEVKLNFKFDVSPLYLCKGIKNKKKMQKGTGIRQICKIQKYKYFLNLFFFLGLYCLHQSIERQV